jgi:hypothetical protein
MLQASPASEPSGLRARLTDPAAIAAAAELLREAGYTEVAVWRHFIEAFAVDLDALSLIMRELFGAPHVGPEPRAAAPIAAPARLKAA